MEVLEKVTPDGFSQWLASNPTKVLLLQLQIDIETIKENWVRDRYDPDEETRAKGQAAYIDGLTHVIKELKPND